MPDKVKSIFDTKIDFWNGDRAFWGLDDLLEPSDDPPDP